MKFILSILLTLCAASGAQAQKLACESWDCDAITRDFASWNGKKGDRFLDFEERLAADIIARRHAEELLGPITMKVIRGGQTVWDGGFDRQTLFTAKPGDRIEFGEGYVSFYMNKLPSNVTIVGRGEKTVLGMAGSFLPFDGIVIENLVMREPRLPDPNYLRGVILLANVRVDIYDERKMFSTAFDNWDAVVAIRGGFSRVSPRQANRLPGYAFGARVATMNEDGDYIEMVGFPKWIPAGPMRDLLGAGSAKPKSASLRKGFTSPATLPAGDIDASLVPAALAEELPAERTAKQKAAYAAVQKWLALKYGGTVKAESAVVALMQKDSEAKRPLSVLARAALMSPAEFAASQTAANLLSDARQALTGEYGCHPTLDYDKSKRAGLEYLTEVDATAQRYAHLTDPLDPVALALLPITRLGEPSPSRCGFEVKVGIDALQQERRVKAARVDKTEWLLTAQGQAKRSARIGDALGSLAKSFDAAGASMERTWKSFDSYRTRIVTTQTGDQFLVSYKGNRNAGPASTFEELERLRGRTRSLTGPGERGDYYPLTTYVIDAERRYRHFLQVTLSARYDSKTTSAWPPADYDQTWSSGACQDRFMDDGASVRTGGTTCFTDDTRALAAAGARVRQEFEGFLRKTHLARLDAAASRRRTASPEEAAEASLYAVLMKRRASADDVAALKKVFGAAPEPLIAAIDKLPRRGRP